MLAKLIGGPGHGVTLKVAANIRYWTWQHGGRNYSYTKHSGTADVALEVVSSTVAVLFFFNQMTSAEKAYAIMVETHAADRRGSWP